MNIFIISLCYIVITLIVGIIVSRKNKNSEDFFVAQGQLNLPLCCVLLLASSFAGAFTTGAAQDSYVGGFAPYLPMVAMGMGYILFAWMVPFYRNASKEGAISVPDVFALRFDNRSKMAIMAINCVAYCVTFAVQPVAFARIVAPMLNLDANAVAWGAAAVMAAMALCGLSGVAWMNTIHCVIMVGGLSLISVVAMHEAGGIETIKATVDPSLWNLFAPDPGTVIIRFVALTLCVFSESETSTIAMSAKSTRTAKQALIIIGIVIFIFSAFLMMIGISARVLLGNELEDTGATLYLLSSNLGAVFNLIASVAVLAAITSSAPAYLIYFSTNVTCQIAKSLSEDNKEKKVRIVSAICIVATAFLGTYFAQRAVSILNVLFNVYEIMTVCGIVVIAGAFWSRVSARSAFWTIAITASVTLVWLILGNPFGIIPGWISTILGIVLIIGLTLTEKEPVAEGYAHMQEIADKHKGEK